MPALGQEYFSYDVNSRIPRGLILIGVALLVGSSLLIGSRYGLWSLYIALALSIVFLLVNELMLPGAMKRVVVVDFDRRVLILHHFIYQLSFWDITPKAEVEIPFDEILGLETIHDRSWTKHRFVYTKQSRFTLHQNLTDHDRLVEILEGIISNETSSVKFVRFQMVVCFAAGLSGLAIVALIGWLLGWI